MAFDSEPSPDQVRGMTERVDTPDVEPYVDFSLFTPHGRRLQKQLELKSWVMNQDSTYHPQGAPGPQDFEAWYACWRIYTNAQLMITKTLTIAGQERRPTSEALEELSETPTKSKRQKKLEKKEAAAEAKRQLTKDWEPLSKTSKEEGKGKAAGKGKERGEHPRRDRQGRYVTTREGTQICFGFQMRKCEGPCRQQRAHVCQTCLQGHRTSECTIHDINLMNKQ